MRDPKTSERHIADIRSDAGWVVEIQHSSISPDELDSREAFYGNMLWIVDAQPFAERFKVGDRLPDPDGELCRDKVFYTKGWFGPYWRTIAEASGSTGSLFGHRLSELANQPGAVFSGHHLFSWTRPRSVWFRATRPVLLDFGGEELVRLMRYGAGDLRCVKTVSKTELLQTLVGPTP